MNLSEIEKENIIKEIEKNQLHSAQYYLIKEICEDDIEESLQLYKQFYM